MLQALWNQFFEKVCKGWPSIDDQNLHRLIEMKNDSIGLFDSYEQAPNLLFEHIRKHEDSLPSAVIAGCLADLKSIKEICELIRCNAPTAYFLERYGYACWNLYGD